MKSGSDRVPGQAKELMDTLVNLTSTLDVQVMPVIKLWKSEFRFDKGQLECMDSKTNTISYLQSAMISQMRIYFKSFLMLLFNQGWNTKSYADLIFIISGVIEPSQAND